MLTEEQKEKLRKIYGDGLEIIATKQNKDGRFRTYYKLDGGRSSLMSTPKLIMEAELGRKLEANETVDHEDYDPTNNDPSNLRVIPRREHCRLDARIRVPVTANCVECGTNFTLTRGQYEPRSAAKAGPFCSKSCAGRYSQRVQMTGIKKKRKIVERGEITTLKKELIKAGKYNT